jgi:Dyp-type peroxidase family
MAVFKWFAKIEAMQAADSLRRLGPLEPFDYASLKPQTAGARIKAAIASFVFKNIIPPALRACQRIWPNPYFKWLNLAIVTRDADVRQVLNDAASFGVPYGPEMTDLGDGTTFALGLDGPSHMRQNQIMRDIMKAPEGRYKEDMANVIEHTRHVAESLLENGAGQIDVITDYITRVATETAARYFGISVNDPVAFGEWTLAMSCMLFGDPTGDEKTRRLGLNAGARLRAVLDDAIDRTDKNFEHHPKTLGRDETILDRLFELKKTDQTITNKEIRAILLGMITGFVPTNTLAASKMLNELLARPKIFAEAVAHAKAGHRDAVKAIIQEAARFDSALAPGQWRVASTDAVIAPGFSRERRIPKDTVVLVSTMTALRDPARFITPNRFRTDRKVWGDLMFGGGPHGCLGSHMAIEQIAEMFMVLLAKDDLRPAPGRLGRMEFVGAFPVRLEMLYTDPAATQSMFLIVAPVKTKISKYALDKELAKLGHGADIRKDVEATLGATGIVHFASTSTVVSERGLDIIIELNVDGTIESAIQTLAEKAGNILRPVLDYADLGPAEDLGACMRRHLVVLHSKPWGATGVNYFGTGEFSVRAIKKQEEFAKLTEDILANYLDDVVGNGNQPMRALTHVRRIIGQDRFHALLKEAGPLMKRARDQGADTYLAKPSRAKLKLADFTNATYLDAFKAFFVAPEGRIVVWPIIALFLGVAYSLYQIVTPPQLVYFPVFNMSDPWAWFASGARIHWSIFGRAAWSWAGIWSGAILATVLVLGAFVGALAGWLRIKELRDEPDPSQATPERVEELGRIEDHPGYAHNHFMALGDFKPGLFRTLVHAFALWGIKMIIIFYYRPGFVVNMGTIHYARWWRLPGTKKSIFFSNYDGSWDSYLEDFITRARWGQTAAWSNWQGFPKTKFLIFDGARDGDRFKRWVRTKQQTVPFWYSRFPHLTTDQIRNNALIHHGLARIQTDSEAREWLRCFGSMPRVDNLIEKDEVQSIVFRGFRDLPYSACLILKLPYLADNKLGYWLKEQAEHINFGDRQVMGQEKKKAGLADGPDFAPKTVMPKTVTNVNQPSQKETVDLQDSIAIALDAKAENSPDAMPVAFLALSAEGFRKIHGATAAAHDLPEVFPPAFKIGMAKRARILGDFDDAAPETWRWSDVPGVGEVSAEAALMIYAATPEALDAEIQIHNERLEKRGGKVLAQTDCAPAWTAPCNAGKEHFGYRDGISQPIIRGTERFAKGVPDRDIVEPGEFILGYKSNQGYFPTSPLVRAEDDFRGDLPMPTERELSRFPDFGVEQSGASPHDFGRNGSFIVIRELEQHVDEFDKFTARKADEIIGRQKSADRGQIAYKTLSRVIGQEPSPDWLKAKLMGRWPDGRPLIGNPVPYDPENARVGRGDTPLSVQAAARHRAEHDNDFSYGIDDPQGLACPFGAHIRRTNPRDSKQPGDEWEQTITNRHRLLRRGRSYLRDDGEKGLLFVALCGDLERQFEFVQQTWANSPAFHGLTDEPDPIIGAAKTMKGDDCPAQFTIPTPVGPVKLTGMERFVTTRAGGYFFLPSRSALTFLKERAFKT